MSVLVITVGGTLDPIRNAIKQGSADFVVFLCSGGERSSEPVAKSVINELGLNESSYQIFTFENPDSIASVQSTLEETLQYLQTHHSGKLTHANYTGGTKTMSAGLVLFAVMHDWKLQIQEGERKDLVKVRGNDFTQSISVDSVRTEIVLKNALRMADSSDFESASSLIASQMPTINDGVSRNRLRVVYNECAFLAAIDRFDLFAAREMLDDVSVELKKRYAKKLATSTHTIAVLLDADPNDEEWKEKARPLDFGPASLLIDGVRAAAKRKRFDEAMARLYRATELVAQIRLYQKYGILTGAPRVDRLPESMRDPAPYNLGLERAWACLGELNDPIGVFYLENHKWVRDTLTYRNQSILAHGFRPISQQDWVSRGERLITFLEDAMRR